MPTNQSQYEEMCEVYERYNKGGLVPVVRCKDCIHREVQVDGVFRYEMCGIRNEIINLDGFCHMGKRRENAIR